ncbi:MAG: twin-arginine translocation pathway signal protein [Alphaproteobacteria bacterium]|nr:twin-arginine translocation pathway signal protein [Alphaproteobacteria bacterium]MDP6564426.1 twin-arginine translocation pathway signal protein [Alphaproteobacteria bacterium]MDP6815623.1 twin-arginine translocation pathway signal protein [Alphaproteobacteria bacterium]
MNRRKFLAVLGGGVIVSAGGAATGFALTRTPTRALAPWREAGSLYDEPRKKALSYAILAPNPHNRQPWLVDLSQVGKVILWVDRSRLLPATDPFNRQITIGLGCFLELLRMAAAEDGHRVSIDPFPKGFDQTRLDERPIAVVSFIQDQTVERDPLFAQVMDRRSLKEPYDLDRELSDQVLRDIAGSVQSEMTVGTTRHREDVGRLRRLTHDAMAIEIETPHTYRESVDLFRIGKAEIEANPDGIDFSGPMFEALGAVGYFTRQAALDPTSTAYRQGIDAVLAQCDTAMGHIWLVTRANTRLDQLNAGRDWLRINLAATRAGVGTQPLSQALQEYPEMRALYDRCHQLLAPNGGTVQMLARLGYAAPVPPSPRWRLATRIMKG